MNFLLRVFLIAGAALVLAIVIRRIRKTDYGTADALFWIALAVLLVCVAVFPEIAYGLSDFFGFSSPSNFVFLAVIAILLFKLFSIQGEIVRLRHKLVSLIQEFSLHDFNDLNNDKR